MKNEYVDLTNLIPKGSDFLQPIFEYITNGITITDDKAKILYVNASFTRITGYSAAEAIGNNPGILHSGRHDQNFYKAMWDSISTTGYWSGEIWNRHKNGYLLPEWITITRVSSKTKRYYIAVFSDISTLIEQNNIKLNLLYTDPLTKLHNRVYLQEAFNIYKNLGATDNNIILLFMDLNKFKSINDTYGHLAGDLVLQKVSAIILQKFSKEDMPIRFGGDEILVIVKNKDNIANIDQICNSINEELKKPIKYNEHNLEVSISVGAAIYPIDAQDLNGVIELADKAMYVAKKSNKLLVYYHDIVN